MGLIVGVADGRVTNCGSGGRESRLIVGVGEGKGLIVGVADGSRLIVGLVDGRVY